MKEIIREVSASAGDVLAAVREDAREWRESAIPPELRKHRIVRVDARIRPPYVELRLRVNAGERGVGLAVLRAAVIAAPGGGARIRGECGRRRGSLVPIALAALAFPTLMSFGGDVESAMIAWAFAFMALVWMMIGYLAPDSRPDPEADYLMQRFEHALAIAEAKASASRAITPARRP